MLKTTLRLGFSAMLIAALAACESTNLIDLNRNFAQLSEQAAQADRQHSEGALDDVQHEALVEVNQMSFAENGDMAVAAAGEADAPRSKASFLNLAVRSYLQSGAVADSKIPGLVEEGLEVCQKPELEGLNGLPATCGYFHIVVPQAISNETIRAVRVLNRKAVAHQAAGQGPVLSEAEGQALNDAFDRFLELIDDIVAAGNRIELKSVDPRFAQAVQRQQQIFFCNAFRTRALFPRAKSGAAWDSEKARAATEARLDAAQSRVGVQSPSADCRNLT